jgi:hypothetical protein
MLRSLVLPTTLILALAACPVDSSSPRDATPQEAPPPADLASASPVARPTPLVDLDASLVPVRTAFNAHAHETRFLTLLSPT